MTATPVLIRQRIEAISATISGVTTVLSGTEVKITTAMLPAIRVLPGRRLRSVPNGSRSAFITRNWRILLYVAPVNAIKPDEDDTVDIGAAEAWLDVLAAAFRKLPRLELNGAGLAYVTGTGELTNAEEPGWLVYKRQPYTGLVNDLPVTYRSTDT